ncbi:FUSC family protein [Sphingomonas paeninsulae]|uniref:FUSC family protein n=1 Tax=Sphingomonas paeninsulae TaxID=2319844 RepID=UPI003D34EC40
MPTSLRPVRSSQQLLAIDPQKFLFSLSSFVAAAATLLITFSASLPRPWWALLTVYVTAQPMAGAFRPKIFYRLGGILTGAAVTIALVPNLQNSPELLILCFAAWTGFCIYLAVLDRTPRAFCFQMAAFSSAVISFPYLDDPGNIFTTTISRVEEMTVAIVCVSIAHALLQPWSVTPVIRARAEAFLVHASRWTAEALGSRHTTLEYEHQRTLATDVTELGMIAIHLPFDQRSAPATRRLVLSLQERLATILPLASATANRLDLLRALAPLDVELSTLVDDVVDWLVGGIEAPAEIERELVERCRLLASRYEQAPDWQAILAISVCERMAEFAEAHYESRLLVQQIGVPIDDGDDSALITQIESYPLARDHGVAALAGLATATAITLYCAVWILLAWPNGSATAAFAALITCSFAVQDDPAPVIGRYLGSTLITFPLAALYLFIILPRVDGYGMLIVTLAPALLWMGYIQADPARSARALPMFSCFIVGMGFLDRFQADFAVFMNTGLAQVGGIVTTLAVTKLFRSANVLWTARRIVRDNWVDLEQLANIRRPFRPAQWTGKGIDRLGLVAARMAVASLGDALHAADGLADIRIGRNIIPIRRALAAVPHDVRRTLGVVLAEVSVLFRDRRRASDAVPPPATLLHAIDAAIEGMLANAQLGPRHQALLALVGMRCNLFPAASPFQRTPAQ